MDRFDYSPPLYKVCKFQMTLVNVLLGGIGIVMLALGGALSVNEDAIREIDGYASPFALSYGVLLIFTTQIGTCGIIYGNRGMLITHKVILILMLILGAVMIMMCVLDNENFQARADGRMFELLKNYYEHEHEGESEQDKKPAEHESVIEMDNLQSKFRCCGVHSFTDWQLVHPKHADLPKSCCPRGFKGNNCTETEMYSDSCYNAFTTHMQLMTSCISYITFVSLVCQAVAIGYIIYEVYFHPEHLV